MLYSTDFRQANTTLVSCKREITNDEIIMLLFNFTYANADKIIRKYKVTDSIYDVNIIYCTYIELAMHYIHLKTCFNSHFLSYNILS